MICRLMLLLRFANWCPREIAFEHLQFEVFGLISPGRLVTLSDSYCGMARLQWRPHRGGQV